MLLKHTSYLCSLTMLWFLHSQSTWAELVLGAIKHKDTLEGCTLCRAAANRCLVLGPEESLLRIHGPTPLQNIYSLDVDFAVQIWSYRVMLLASGYIAWISVSKRLTNAVRVIVPSSLFYFSTLARKKSGAGWMQVFWLPDPASRSPSALY